ncbi:pentapeptide repeat-containing protein [Actinocrispum sp. NPDC049592]|uniref:pentapeptide repeat-containing protein n=1 Tax=Actinocrispum sp. NPDC049592 TaxID=3154835 RepID=UPI003440B1B7
MSLPGSRREPVCGGSARRGLSGTNMSATNLTGANLTTARLNGADLTDAIGVPK